MAILTKEVEVKLNGNNIKHYKKLGYEIPMREASKTLKIKGVDYVADLGKIINVKVNDLPLKSNILIEAMCDYCGEVNHSIKYVTYNSQTKNNTQKYACKKCSQFKVEQTNLEKYGVKCEICAYYFDVDRDVCVQRVAQRNKDRSQINIPIEVVYSFSDKIIPPTFEEGFNIIKIVRDGKVAEVIENE